VYLRTKPKAQIPLLLDFKSVGTVDFTMKEKGT
jgi:hypothetical protein